VKINYLKTILMSACLAGTSLVTLAQSKPVNVIYIGDSITADGHTTAAADSDLAQMGVDLKGSSNQGHSGFTTQNFLPGSETFKQVEAAGEKLKLNGGQLVFSIMLGTNDSAMKGTLGAPMPKETYAANLKMIIDQLLKDFPSSIVIIHRQTWYSPNTYNGSMYLQEGLDRLQTYYPEIKRLLHAYSHSDAGKVYLGDTKAFQYFKKNYLTQLRPENGHQGTFYLHPNKTGGPVLAMFWSKAIYKAINKS
jgi:hypothetical protein